MSKIMFWKKSKEEEVVKEPLKEERVFFPEPSVKKLYHLYDTAVDSKSVSDRYNLWKFIHDTLEIDTEPQCSLNIDNVLSPYVIIKPTKDKTKEN